jgi:hypothetical protein
MIQKPLLLLPREEFNRSAAGARMIASGLFAAFEESRAIYDDWKPYLLHEVLPPAPGLPGSYYSLFGWKRGHGTLFAGISLGNGGFDPAEGKVAALGDEHDRIDAHFVISPDEPEIVELRRLNRFRRHEEDPAAAAAEALREIEGYLRLLERGHPVDFQQARIAAWQESGASFDPRNKLAEIWARAGQDAPQVLARRPVRRLIGEGVYPFRTYRPLSGPK